MLTLAVISVCFLFAFLGAQAASPFMDAAKLGRANDTIAIQVKHLQLENQRDERNLRLMQTNAGIEHKARESGWMRPEERRFRIPQTNLPGIENTRHTKKIIESGTNST